MIHAVEPVCTGFSHAHVNAALLATVRLAWPDEAVVFTAEPAHLDAVRGYLDANSVHSVELRALDHGRISYPRTPLDKAAVLPFCMRILSAARRDGATRVLLTASYTPHLLFLDLLTRTTHRDIPVLAIAHSLMQNLLHAGGPRWLPRLADVLRRSRSGRLRVCVPADCIRRRAIELVPDANVAAIDLAYFFPDTVPVPPAPPPLRLGFLGVGSRRKGIDLFYRLAAELTATHEPGAFAFELVGRIEDAPSPEWANAPVSAERSGRLLTEAERSARLSRLHVAVFPYLAAEYELVASAAFLDAVAAGIPVLAMRTPYFEEQFARFGDIGELCDSYDTLKAAAGRCLGDTGAHWSARRRNLLAARAAFSPETLAPQLRALWPS